MWGNGVRLTISTFRKAIPTRHHASSVSPNWLPYPHVLTAATLPRGNLRCVAVAWAVWRNTSMPQKWIASRLALRSASNVSQRVRGFDQAPQRDLPRPIRAWKKKTLF
jgi:hypothetical protein